MTKKESNLQRTEMICDDKDQAVQQPMRGTAAYGSARASVAELRAIAENTAIHVQSPYVDHAELLYDERGLPR